MYEVEWADSIESSPESSEQRMGHGFLREYPQPRRGSGPTETTEIVTTEIQRRVANLRRRQSNSMSLSRLLDFSPRDFCRRLRQGEDGAINKLIIFVFGICPISWFVIIPTLLHLSSKCLCPGSLCFSGGGGADSLMLVVLPNTVNSSSSTNTVNTDCESCFTWKDLMMSMNEQSKRHNWYYWNEVKSVSKFDTTNSTLDSEFYASRRICPNVAFFYNTENSCYTPKSILYNLNNIGTTCIPILEAARAWERSSKQSSDHLTDPDTAVLNYLFRSGTYPPLSHGSSQLIDNDSPNFTNIVKLPMYECKSHSIWEELYLKLNYQIYPDSFDIGPKTVILQSWNLSDSSESNIFRKKNSKLSGTYPLSEPSKIRSDIKSKKLLFVNDVYWGQYSYNRHFYEDENSTVSKETTPVLMAYVGVGGIADESGLADLLTQWIYGREERNDDVRV